MRPIGAKLLKMLERMPRMKMCEMSWENDKYGPCEGRIQWHHVWIYAGTQINELWAILGACTKHHDMVKTNRGVKEAFERRSLELATEKDFDKYPNKAWHTLIKYLNAKEKIYS